MSKNFSALLKCRSRTDSELVAKDMPRLKYVGRFDLDQIPAIGLAARNLSDLQNSDLMMEPKAIAIHPYGILHVSLSRATLYDAEVAALYKCNRDTRFASWDGPCFLYATDNDIVLKERLREAP